MRRIKDLLKHNRQAFSAALSLLEGARGLTLRAARTFKGIDANKVVFSSLIARTYGDNLKPISEMLHAMRPETDIVWMFRDVSKKAIVPDYVRVVKAESAAALREYGTAKVWVDNFTLRRYYRHKKGRQFYMNTWHGDRAFKKYAYDAFPDSPRRVEEDCDIMLAGSEFGKKVMRSAFRYNGELLVAGSPRNDCLVNWTPEAADALRDKMGISRNVKLLIYCPTFRDSTINEAFKGGIDLEKMLDDLERVTGDEWKCLFRAHHLARGGLALNESGRLIDMSGYEDMADLLMISDALVTDYSSAAMDFCLLGKPVYIYQDDIDDYTSNDRQLHFPMETSPFWTAHDQEELTALIEATTEENARENCRAICDFFGFIETGRATEKCCEQIIKWLDA